MYPEAFCPSEFKKKGFYKKAEGKLFKRENGKGNFCYLSIFWAFAWRFKTLTAGHSDYRGIVVLNCPKSWRWSFKAQYIPCFAAQKA